MRILKRHAALAALLLCAPAAVASTYTPCVADETGITTDRWEPTSVDSRSRIQGGGRSIVVRYSAAGVEQVRAVIDEDTAEEGRVVPRMVSHTRSGDTLFTAWHDTARGTLNMSAFDAAGAPLWPAPALVEAVPSGTGYTNVRIWARTPSRLVGVIYRNEPSLCDVIDVRIRAPGDVKVTTLAEGLRRCHGPTFGRADADHAWLLIGRRAVVLPDEPTEDNPVQVVDLFAGEPEDWRGPTWALSDLVHHGGARFSALMVSPWMGVMEADLAPALAGEPVVWEPTPLDIRSEKVAGMAALGDGVQIVSDDRVIRLGSDGTLSRSDLDLSARHPFLTGEKTYDACSLPDGSVARFRDQAGLVIGPPEPLTAVTAPGSDRDGDGVADAADACPAQPGGPAPLLSGCPVWEGWPWEWDGERDLQWSPLSPTAPLSEAVDAAWAGDGFLSLSSAGALSFCTYAPWRSRPREELCRAVPAPRGLRSISVSKNTLSARDADGREWFVSIRNEVLPETAWKWSLAVPARVSRETSPREKTDLRRAAEDFRKLGSVGAEPLLRVTAVGERQLALGSDSVLYLEGAAGGVFPVPLSGLERSSEALRSALQASGDEEYFSVSFGPGAAMMFTGNRAEPPPSDIPGAQILDVRPEDGRAYVLLGSLGGVTAWEVHAAQ